MLDIRITGPGEVLMKGRFDASQTDKVRAVLDQVTTTAVVDLKGLEYVSSAGLGVLLAAQKRLTEKGHQLKLANMSKHVRDIFQITRLETVFEIIET